MFLVYSHSDSIRVPPSELGQEISAMLANEIDFKYSNRVLPGVGLVVSLFSVDVIGESIIYPGDGGASTHGASWSVRVPARARRTGDGGWRPHCTSKRLAHGGCDQHSRHPSPPPPTRSPRRGFPSARVPPVPRRGALRTREAAGQNSRH